jgi:hypothetical protein
MARDDSQRLGQLKYIKCLFLVFKCGYFHPNIARERERTELFLQLFQKLCWSQLEMGKGFFIELYFSDVISFNPFLIPTVAH